MMNSLIFGHRYSREDEMWLRLQRLREEGVRMIGVCGLANFISIAR